MNASGTEMSLALILDGLHVGNLLSCGFFVPQTNSLLRFDAFHAKASSAAEGNDSIANVHLHSPSAVDEALDILAGVNSGLSLNSLRITWITLGELYPCCILSPL